MMNKLKARLYKKQLKEQGIVNLQKKTFSVFKCMKGHPKEDRCMNFREINFKTIGGEDYLTLNF